MLLSSLRRWILAGLLAFALINGAPAQAGQADLSRAFSEWMSYYYMDKDASKVPVYLQWIERVHLLEGNDDGIPTISAFFATIFSDHSGDLRNWLSGLKLTGNAKLAVEKALWLSGNSRLVVELFRETPSFVQKPPIKIQRMQVTTQGELDMMWGAFLASGDSVYLDPVIDLLSSETSLTGSRSQDAMLRRSAEWSLANNMNQHDLVNRLLREAARARSGFIKRRLEDMIARFDKYLRTLPVQDGPFSAQLVLPDPKAPRDDDQDENEVNNIKEISTATPGQSLPIKIFYIGQGLTRDYAADVSYDIKVLRPDGSIFDGINLENQPLAQMKMPVRLRISSKTLSTVLRFGKSDPPGTYRIRIKLYDHVGRKQVTLSKDFTLRP